MTIKRCPWASTPLEEKYHDQEWGIPKYEDHVLFYMLILEGMQAGLSWRTILQKWDAFFLAYDQFDLECICTYTEAKEKELLENTGIIRNKLKIKSVISNAKAFKRVQKEFGSFSHYIWSFIDHQPIVNRWLNSQDIPAKTPLSETISQDLKTRGFKFVGPTIIYAYMQSIGMVNDHLLDCAFYHHKACSTT